MSYQIQLPSFFPVKVIARPERVKRLVEDWLFSLRADVSQGSSFAVTVDNWNGTWNLWLLRASYSFLKDALIEGEDIVYKMIEDDPFYKDIDDLPSDRGE